jgi:uncharacterized protein (TIGR02466 family)
MRQDFKATLNFSTPIWEAVVPEYLDKMNFVSDHYLKDLKIKDEPSYHSASMVNDPSLNDFKNFCFDKSKEFLNWCGFDLTNHNLKYTEMWVQEFNKKGGGYHSSHIHPNQHVSGFYFLKGSSQTSHPVFHDPRPGAMMIKLPEKKEEELSLANSCTHRKVVPGLMIIFPGYLSHEYLPDLGLDDFRFIHWNIQAIQKDI